MNDRCPQLPIDDVSYLVIEQLYESRLLLLRASERANERRYSISTNKTRSHRIMKPMIVILKEGTDSSQGKSQILSNISACQAVAETVRTTLGPRGMDKLIVDNRGKATISNDGATILKLLEIVHPAARTLVDIAKSQDAEVGDGTTSVVLLTAEILKNMKVFIEDGMHPTIIIRAIRKGTALATKKIRDIAIKVKSDDPQ